MAKRTTTDKKLSQIDAAAKVLSRARKPMSCKEMVEAMTKRKLWSSPGGKTPDQTLYASILRDLKKAVPVFNPGVTRVRVGYEPLPGA